MKFMRFIEIIRANGFDIHRQSSGSHAIYRGVVSGNVKFVTVAAHRMSDDIKPGTLASMIRQSGLPKDMFRN